MLKRLIEVALPLKEVSEQSAREKSIRHGHISTLHIWWARRPLAACRAAVFASLIPDPDDPECPDEFRKLVMDVLGKNQFQPKNGDGSSVEDTPRNRCLEFIKHLVRWENSNNLDYIDPARKLIVTAHKFLHPDAEGDTPKVLDPFAGGGAIPLEALRLGCESYAVDLNPVAHLIQLCTLVYPQKYAKPDSRPVPDYIKQLVNHHRSKRIAKHEAELFDNSNEANTAEFVPDVDITIAEYRENPLATDVMYWGHWVLKVASQDLRILYPVEKDGSEQMAYLWARTVRCPNPTCRAEIPLLQRMWLHKKGKHKKALHLSVQNRKVEFTVAVGRDINEVSANDGTLKRGNALCPICEQTADVKYLRTEANAGRLGERLLAVVVALLSGGRGFRISSHDDLATFEACYRVLEKYSGSSAPVEPPDEPLPPIGTLGFRINRYGFLKWKQFFNNRQLAAALTFVAAIRRCFGELANHEDEEYAKAVATCLAIVLDRTLVRLTSQCIWDHTTVSTMQLFNQGQSLPMRWDYVETNPIIFEGSNWATCVEYVVKVLRELNKPGFRPAVCKQGSATQLPFNDSYFDCAITDPPYYDAVPYADLSDFFYVWERRVLRDLHPGLFRTPLTPKRMELIAYGPSGRNGEKTAEWYEQGMETAFHEMCRTVNTYGLMGVMFAHKTTSAWETLITALIKAGLNVTASWPLRTESGNRLRAANSAALASSVLLLCRKRPVDNGNGFWDDVRQELKQVAQERLDFFWNQGIRGADFFISAIGPALSVFGKYERVTKLSGEEVTVGQFLDEVRSLVTNYALTKILHTTHTAAIDPESRFYVVWKWSYGDAKVPADESFKLSQALGMHTEELWDRTGVLEKSGENVNAVPIAQRMKVRNLGEPGTDGAPASLIDVLHRLCTLREKGDTQGMAQCLGQSGHSNNPTLWLVAQAISEILPDGEKEKQLMQGLLNQRENLEEATRQRALF